MPDPSREHGERAIQLALPLPPPRYPIFGRPPRVVDVGEFEAALARYPLRFLAHRQPEVELAAFPPMIAIYWALANENEGLPPLQSAFAEHVTQYLPHLPRPGVLARLYRAYPSFVRQHHLWLLLQDHFDWVGRGEWVDLAGLDFVIFQDGFVFGLADSVQTSAASEWQQVKRRRHPPLAGVPIYDLHVAPGRHQVGKFWLHDGCQAAEIQRLVEKEIQRRRQEAMMTAARE
jgi:hypothetical protein